MIAMMLIPEPEVLIADEPTSALDVSVQAQVLDIIDELVRTQGHGLILISHDLNPRHRLLRPHPRHECRTGGGGMRGGAARARAASLYAGLLAAMPTINESRDELPVLDRSQWPGT